METLPLFQQLGISVLLGLLVGLQREHAASRLAGFRTFPLITLFGTILGFLSKDYGGWILAAGFIAMAAVMAIGNAHKLKQKDFAPDPGTTTEVAMLLMFGVGAYLTVGPPLVAVAVGGAVAILLHFKPELHRFAGRLGEDDLRAIMQFVLITFIILPIVPNRAYGPFDVLNPYEIWLMVVLIVGISLGGYITYRFLGERAGVLFGGVLGGIISSTATTVSYSRRTVAAPQIATSAAVIIVIASAVMYGRVLIEVSVVSPALLRVVTPPILLLLGLSLALAAIAWFRRGETAEKMPEQKNPSELKSAIVFGVLYALVLLGLAAAREYVGERGLYVVAGLSGLTDMDAITLSTARLVQTERLTTDAGWRMIVIGAMSNLVFKSGLVAVVGNRPLLWRVLLLFGIHFAGGVLILLFW